MQSKNPPDSAGFHALSCFLFLGLAKFFAAKNLDRSPRIFIKKQVGFGYQVQWPTASYRHRFRAFPPDPHGVLDKPCGLLEYHKVIFPVVPLERHGVLLSLFAPYTPAPPSASDAKLLTRKQDKAGVCVLQPFSLEYIPSSYLHRFQSSDT